MHQELSERVSGVGVLIIPDKNPPERFLTLVELHTKRSTNKLRGMQSFPMETIEDGEDHQQALIRLFEEEVRLDGLLSPQNLTQIKLCRAELTPGVVLHTYLIELDKEPKIKLGTASGEVIDPRWTPLNEVVTTPNSLKFRPGVFEAIRAYRAYQTSPEAFEPATFRYIELRDNVPKEIFDLIGQGLTETEAVYQYNLPRLPRLAVPAPNRLTV